MLTADNFCDLFDTLIVFLKEFLEKGDFEKISRRQKIMQNYPAGKELTLKGPITTAADDIFCDISSNFEKNKVWYFMRIVCSQTILMKYHALFVIFEKAAKFEIVACCKLHVALYGLM